MRLNLPEKTMKGTGFWQVLWWCFSSSVSLCLWKETRSIFLFLSLENLFLWWKKKSVQCVLIFIMCGRVIDSFILLFLIQEKRPRRMGKSKKLIEVGKVTFSSIDPTYHFPFHLSIAYFIVINIIMLSI